MIKLSFVLLTILMAVLLLLGLSKAASVVMPSDKHRRFTIQASLIVTGWLAYSTILSLAGVFTASSLRPRLPLLLVLPAFIFMAYFFNSQRFKHVIDATPLPWLTYTQSFRILVELLLVSLYAENLLPREATFEGYNFDIIIGITALLVGYLGFAKKVFPRFVIVLWNFAGLCTLAIVVSIIMKHAYFPVSTSTESSNFSISNFGTFPYTFLASFLMPMAVFMHVFSLVKIKRAKG